MSTPHIPLVFFFYGLAFFSMGLAVALEGGRGSDARLGHALRPLAGFGIIHGLNEWIEMGDLLGILPGQNIAPLAWKSLNLAILAFSFLSLTAFGASLLASNERTRRLSWTAPLVQAALWGFGLLILRGRYDLEVIWNIADVWSRYVLAIPASLTACAGLIAQQRAFRRAGMARFGRDSLFAAVAFIWYGIVGQLFTRPSALFPSTVVNEELFYHWFGFPVQILRAAAALVVAVFVIRFLRASEVETRRQISALQRVQLEEAQQRETLRGELFKRVVAAQEAERQRIARELHDETGQTLTAIGLGLRGVTTTLRKDLDLSAKNLRKLEGLVADSLDELQRIIADLRPSHLDDLGLPAALRWYAGEIQERANLNVQVEVTGTEQAITAEIKIAIFRVIQEALTNVIKHAQASSARVSLTYGERNVRVQVHDDGCGFNVQRVGAADRPSWGLTGMRERASLLGGEFILDSQIGAGTQICISIPYQLNGLSEKEEALNGNPASDR